MAGTILPGCLLPQHAALVEASAIGTEVAQARGYRTVESRAELERLGFTKPQRKVPCLLIPIYDVHGQIATYQIRPDEPRIGKGGKALKYETPSKSHLVLDVPPSIRPLLGDPRRPLFITEGARKADSAVSVGLCCVALLGVWGWRGTNGLGGKAALPDWESVALNGRVVYIVFDSDVMTKPEVHGALERLKAFLHSRKARVRIIYLPANETGDKAGLDDYLAGGRTLDDLLALASDHLKPIAANSPEVGDDTAPYLIERGRICVERQTRDGAIVTPLCNFVARVTEELILDDGADKTRTFAIEGTLDNGTPLPTARVPVDRFGAMNWIPNFWGLRAVPRAGFGTKDQLREAIQRLSPNAPSRTVFTHTGWRQIDERYVYLASGGGVGTDGIEVDLGQQLSRYMLPRTAIEPKNAMKASINLLRVAPLIVTAPLWAGVFRAPLIHALPLDHSLWLEGQTGSLKSTLAALFLSHWGDFDRLTLPGAWISSANHLEHRAFVLKDVMFVIDEYVPTPQDRRDWEMKAARLLRAQGNLAGRGRLRADLSDRSGFHPRGLIVATGEERPTGQGVFARTLFLPLARQDVKVDLLSAAQLVAGQLPHALAGYLQWLAPQMENLR